MKKFYFLAVIALVAGVSCAKQVPDATQDKDVAISFSPVSQRVGTKANVYGEQNATYTAGAPGAYESFAAWANYTAAAHDTTNPQTDGSVFFGADDTGVQCDHATAVGGEGTDYWAPATTYYWPRAGYLHFHAMSPANFGTGTLAHDWESGISITGYVAPQYTDGTAVEQTADNQIDLMYSDFIFDQQRSSYTQTGNTVGTYDDDDDSGIYKHDGVNVLFRHALSLVQFKVKTAADYYGTGPHKHQFYVRKIEVLNAYNTGNFAENRANTANNNYAVPGSMTGKIGMYADNSADSAGDGTGNGTPYWSDFSNEVTLTPYDVTAGTAMNGTEATTTSASSTVGTTLITLPQALGLHPQTPPADPKNVKVRVTFDYQFSVDNGAHWTQALDQVITVDLSGAKGTYDSTGTTPVANYVVNNWLINHKYIYTLQFKLDPIIFDPAVEAFVTVGDITVDLPF